MKIEPQKTQQLTQLGDLIKNTNICMLITFDEDGLLVSRPMAPLEMCEQGAIWFLTDSHSSKSQHLGVVNLSFSDESNGTYVSISGHGELIADRQRIESLWTAFAKPWFPDGVESSNLAALKIVANNAEYWDAPHSKMVRMFAMAASIVASKPIGMGDHGNLSDLAA